VPLKVKAGQIGREHRIDIEPLDHVGELFAVRRGKQIIPVQTKQTGSIHRVERMGTEQKQIGFIGLLKFFLQPAALPAKIGGASAVEKNQAAVARWKAEVVRTKVVIKAKTPDAALLLGAEGQQIRHIQPRQCAVDGAIFILSPARHSIAGGYHKVVALPVQLRNDFAFKNAHRVADIAHHCKAECCAPSERCLDVFHLNRVFRCKIPLKEVEVDLVGNQNNRHRQAEPVQPAKHFATHARVSSRAHGAPQVHQSASPDGWSESASQEPAAEGRRLPAVT